MITEETVIEVLEKQIKLFEYVIKKIEIRDGIDDSNAKPGALDELVTKLNAKIIEFRTAINTLSNTMQQ